MRMGSRRPLSFVGLKTSTCHYLSLPAGVLVYQNSHHHGSWGRPGALGVSIGGVFDHAELISGVAWKHRQSLKGVQAARRMAHNQDHPKFFPPSLFSFFLRLRLITAVLTVQFPSKTVNVAWRTPISRVRHGTTAGCLPWLTGRYAASPFLCLAWAPAAWRLAVMFLDPPEPRVGAGGCPHGP